MPHTDDRDKHDEWRRSQQEPPKVDGCATMIFMATICLTLWAILSWYLSTR